MIAEVKIQSFNELKYKSIGKDFVNIVSIKMKLPQVDTIRDILKVIDNQGVYKMHSEIIKKAKQNEVLEEGTIDGYRVVNRYTHVRFKIFSCIKPNIIYRIF